MGFPLLLLFPTPLTVRWRKPDLYWTPVNGADFPLMIKTDSEKETGCEQNVKRREAADHWNSQDSLHRPILYRKSCVGGVYVSESSNSQQTCKPPSCQSSPLSYMTSFVEYQQHGSLILGRWFWVERKGPLPTLIQYLPPKYRKASSTAFIFTRSGVAEGVFSGSGIIP